MGNGIAHVAALSGFDVRLADLSSEALQKGVDTIAKNLERQVSKERISPDDRDRALSRISSGTSVEEAAGSADLVVEAAPEKSEIKFELFRVLDGVAPPGAILATNTSSISVTEIAAQTG